MTSKFTDNPFKPSSAVTTITDVFPSDGPISTLPPELIVGIFQAYSACDDSPWRLACVCMRWREIALRSSFLWRHMRLTCGEITDRYVTRWSVPGVGKTILTVGRAQVCAEKEELDQAILRSGSSPLDIDVIFSWRTDFESPSYQLLAQDLLSSIFERKDICSRIEQLAFTLTHSSLDPSTFPIPNSLPNLKALEWVSHNPLWAPSFRRLLPECKKLASLHLSFPVLSSLSDVDMWRNVHSLVIHGSGHFNFSLGARDLDSVIPACPSLKELKVTPFVAWPRESTPPITCRQLRILKLCCEARHLQRIRAPLLTALDVYELSSSSHQRTEDISLDFPDLETLVVQSPDPRWIFKFNFTKLKSLGVIIAHESTLMKRVGTKVTVWENIFRPDGFPTVKNARFEAVGRTSLFMAALASVPNSERIEIIPDTFQDPEFGLQLVRQLYAPGTVSMCGKASHIQFGNRWCCFGVQRTSFEPSLRALVAIRQGWPTPLQSLRVYWTMGIEPTEYV
ncbi:hypothetical protein FRC15_000901 [Serendipita sp. 397]|nr:hypothetical protein FRC15_000901 [Serendipita sp. 397]